MDIQRDIVSFVRRSPRMNPGQVRALSTLGPHLIVDVPHGELDTQIAPGFGPLDLTRVFGRRAPLFVELGSGRGETAAAIGAAHPELDYLAFEVFLPGVASSLIRLREAGVENVRFVVADGAQGIRQLLPDGSVQELRVLFPDPWQKKRHAKRRLIQTAFADEVARVLAPGGLFRIATDWEEYALHCREVMDVHPRFGNPWLSSTGSGNVAVETGWAPRDPERPVTKFEQRGIDAGRRIFDMTYELRP